MIGFRLSMTHIKKVLLYGNSLFITGLQSSLETEAGLEVRRVKARTGLLRKQLRAAPPDTLILELGSLPGDFCLDLLKEFPRLKLIGLDTESNRLLDISVQQEAPLAAAELARLIRGREDTETRGRGDTEKGRHGEP
jgi:hypothetical protein